MTLSQEALRKLIHIGGAVTPPLGLFVVGWAGAVGAALAITLYLVIGGVMERRGTHLPVVGAVVKAARRPTESFPVEPLEYILAILVLGVLLPASYWFAAIGVLAFGDGVAGVVGRRWGRHPLPWNRRKSWEGLVAGIVAAVLAAGALTWLGEQMEGATPLVTQAWAVLFLLVLGALVGLALARIVSRATRGENVANASALVTASAMGACLLVAAAPILLVETGFIRDGPVMENIGLATPPWSAWAVPAAACLILESVLRRHDNAVIPPTYAVLSLAMTSWL